MISECLCVSSPNGAQDILAHSKWPHPSTFRRGNWTIRTQVLPSYMIWDILNKRYHDVNELGYKGYSTVWLAWDSQNMNYVRVGVAEADSSLQKETEVLRALSAPLPELSSALQAFFLLMLRGHFQWSLCLLFRIRIRKVLSMGVHILLRSEVSC